MNFEMDSNVYEMNFKSGQLEPMKDSELKIGQIVWLNGYGQSEFSHKREAIYQVDNKGFSGRIRYSTVNLETFVKSTHDAYSIKHSSKIFGIGIYYSENDFAQEQEINAALLKADELIIRQNEEKQKADVEANRKRAIGIEVLKDIIPANAKCVIVASLQKDESDLQSDYFHFSTERTVILGFSNSTRENFKEMRKVAGNFEETEKYSIRPVFEGDLEEEKYWEPKDENREKYAGGHGFYLGESKYHGWIIEKVRINSLESFMNEFSIVASDPQNIRLGIKDLPNKQIDNIPTKSLEIIDYSAKAIAIAGDTKSIKDILYEKRGRFNPNLTNNGQKFAGWIFPKSKESELRLLLGL